MTTSLVGLESRYYTVLFCTDTDWAHCNLVRDVQVLDNRRATVFNAVALVTFAARPASLA